MATPLLDTRIKTGITSIADFAEDCQSGDWNTWSVTFPVPFPSGKGIRVIVTAVRDGGHVPSPVGTVSGVGATGFTLRARNSDCVAGRAAFNWVAFQEGDTRVPEGTDVRIGVLQPRGLAADCELGDTTEWKVPFSKPAFGGPPFQDEIRVVVTATDVNVVPLDRFDHSHHSTATIEIYRTIGPAPVVGTILAQTADDFAVKGRNSDCASGFGNFYYAAFAPANTGGKPDFSSQQLFVDSGEVPAVGFEAHCKPGDWQGYADVYFETAFLTPPIVLLTASDTGISGGGTPIAAVGQAVGVTPNGFRIRARNSDCAKGRAGFHWVALGCVLGCA